MVEVADQNWTLVSNVLKSTLTGQTKGSFNVYIRYIRQAQKRSQPVHTLYSDTVVETRSIVN